LVTAPSHHRGYLMASAGDLIAAAFFGSAHDRARRERHGCIPILLDPGRFLTTLGTDHICDLHKVPRRLFPSIQMLRV
jgi:hypothetical protein